jgi:capsular exopolysaccharide synthesis family protein
MPSSSAPSGSAPRRAAPPAKPAKNAGPDLPQLSPREMLLAIRERALPALVIAVLACALLGGWLLSRPRIYSASARLLADRGERVLNMDQVVDQSVGSGKNDAMFETYLAQITSPAMVTRVLASLTQAEKERAWRPHAAADEPVPSNLDGALRGVLAGNVSASRQGSTFFISIRVRHRDPASAALLASRFATEFIGHQLDRSTAANNSAVAFLREQTEELRAKAEASERALQQYRERTGMVSLDDRQNIVVERMKTLSSTVTSARVARLALEARLRQAETILQAGGDPLELAATTEFANLAAIHSQIDGLRTQRAIMGERYGARHPSMIDNQRSREALEKLRGDLISVAMANLRNLREKALSEETELEAQLKAAERESLRLDELAVQFNVLRREAETARQIYTQLLNRLNETVITAQLESTNIRVSDLASVPGAPVEPDTRKTVLLLAALGLGIFVGYPISIELLFNRVKGWADIESYLGVPLLGEMPALKKIPPADLPHLLSRGDDEEAAELVRSLYAQIKLSSRLDFPKSILITSTTPAEGKSFVAANLAGAFAAHGLSTLLVDTDLRRPTQHRLFDQKNEKGLLTWIQEGGRIPDEPLSDPSLGIVSCGPSLHLLRTGGQTRRSTEVLDSAQVRDLFASLRKSFDVVIIDTPPAGVFLDALTLSEVVDELVYVIRYNHVSRPAVRRVLERFSRGGVEVAGAVLNLMPTGRGSNGYYSGYGYYGSKYYKAYQTAA